MKWNEMEFWQKKKVFSWVTLYILICIAFLSFVCFHMISERNSNTLEYETALKNSEESVLLKERLSVNAVPVSTGTYVESIKDISFKNSNYRVSFITWFRWEGTKDFNFLENGIRIYNGTINKQESIKDYYKDGVHYQEMRMDVTVSKNFNITRFPLGSQVLKFYIEPNKYTIDEVVLVPDKTSSRFNPSLNISGYKLERHDVGEHITTYPNTMSNPRFKSARTTSELVTIMEVSRNDWGLYIKCFIALIGTCIWAFMALYICGNHHVNPLGTIPACLFGTIANLMIGANLLPDVVELGLVEFVNIYATLIIMGCLVSIININRIRENKLDKKFEKFFGRSLFFTLLILCVIGQIIMPLSAMVWGK